MCNHASVFNCTCLQTQLDPNIELPRNVSIQALIFLRYATVDRIVLFKSSVRRKNQKNI